MIKTVMFDVDDTVYDFHHANACAVENLADYTSVHFGWSKEEFLEKQKAAMADIKRFTGTSGGYRTRLLRYQNMLEAAGIPIEPHAMKMSCIYRDTLLENMKPEEGVEEWMRSLRAQKILILIASDATAQQQFMKLERLGLLQYIDAMVTSEEAGVEKPDPKFFERCNEKSRCQPCEVMFIGDNPEKDYFGASLAGYNAVWYNPLHKSNSKSMRELNHFSEAPVLLEELNT